MLNSINRLPVLLNSVKSRYNLRCFLIQKELSERIASKRNVQIQWQWDHEAKSVMCDDTYQQLFSQAIRNSDLETEFLFSGAGHDAMAMATICPVGMLFIRSPDGLSHHPDESIIFSDVTKAIQVTESALTSYSEIFGEPQ